MSLDLCVASEASSDDLDSRDLALQSEEPRVLIDVAISQQGQHSLL